MTEEKIKKLTEALLSLVIKIDEIHTKRAISSIEQLKLKQEEKDNDMQ